MKHYAIAICLSLTTLVAVDNQVAASSTTNSAVVSEDSEASRGEPAARGCYWVKTPAGWMRRCS